MSDRFLAITLALVLALPLCLSLDGDLFDSRQQPDPAAQAESLLAAPLPETPPDDDQLLQEVAREAARRFSHQALEAMQQQVRELDLEALDNKVTWRSAPEATGDFHPASR